MTSRDVSLLEMIAARMSVEGATDVTDAEIRRTLSECCAPTMLIRKAKEFRDSGLLAAKIFRSTP